MMSVYHNNAKIIITRFSDAAGFLIPEIRKKKENIKVLYIKTYFYFHSSSTMQKP